MTDFESHLAPYAARSAQTRGRVHAEPASLSRSEFQRDRDRVIHSTAFRRLEYKTQVFVNHEGDLFRTRLTHSLEVAQIARSIARNLRLNEDLVEAISLAHDLGHTPFGHAGQDALNQCMKNHGGFEHNLQSLLVVDELEERYGGFNGLNLTFETREGILKHCSRVNASALGELGRRFLEGTQPSLEAQLANLADEIAYNNHDIDDGLRSGLLTLEQLDEVPMWGRHRAEVAAAFPGINGRRAINETVRRMINTLIVDLIETTSRNIADANPRNIDAVRAAGPLVGFSAPLHEEAAALKRFLFRHLYRHYLVMRMSAKAQRIIGDLFQAFMSDPRLLPPQYQASHGGDQPRLIAHYIAGMTDRYAIREHRRIFAVSEGTAP
ncbi:deoxyguanosinetriphosphate triphosphohydrolase [Cupriavidus taiwanensis]|uniref:Deoxyguanosinetriphosphate triphosphohydrolase-like protein n=1 Tax=Cupriavidus taiwanensis TaxID=164546 RepID=A0A375GYM4_9BURK|nr:deoxyguanosinetriphosphate triphosphohydrolase [Cupriavidus taiwanensis]SOY51868.1 deoxyguanosine triphosphate triphosphohydrolase [Cupriavidus taiwanensis]SOY52088.1 deoxyguanosine triphosphate triphosphohydrolase [Cupriavidus taiwanensis]SOY84450.1 deoxyguanosine triphosphate triphosphohydrolase [Cupriavidus taiwanensis]SOZ24354.1 deoxyguanosine triphosphate triphosphohydrolase [Cupriavidus taiwanensis]SOZ59134.1 deoxyguanosine triphosphate triphosphohydrolase [Cupriavidus taiwanensis]